jgi:hypothetical protein
LLYIDVIIRRYEAATHKTAILAETGESFATLLPADGPDRLDCSHEFATPVAF